ncbi:MAG: hypothetical protein E6G63_05300 [Actinobacteria bacterium]|nr:MAG: hypothetical protein E6G63_05300 [Actinomycetota bacterium]
MGSEARDHGRADGRPRRDPDGQRARARPPAGRPRSRGDHGVAQPERCVQGGGPGRRALSRQDGLGPADGRARSADRRRPDDERRVDPRRGSSALHGGLTVAKVDEPAPSSSSVQQSEELTAAAESRAELAVSPELVAGSVSEYLRASLSRIRAGQVGVLPVVGGLLLVSVLFQSLNGHFLTAGNLVNLLVQAAVFSVLAMGEVYALLLGEIDLSIGYVAGLSGVVLAELLKPSGLDWPWWAAILVALAVCAAIGALQGSLVTRVGLPSFVVTLAGLLFWQGVMLKILGNGGSVLISNTVVNDIASGNLSPIAGWVARGSRR